ncbi:MAG: membrane protein insertion efficiency factor YidD [Candidatus Hydrogenedentes bacterium]|nr:membrane protein insertion efficiency factor YidD [Candidatus Hydrogenedentota bacterium]
MVSKVLIGLVRLYQWGISPLLGANCRFTPTCSRYAIEAIQKHGSVRGIGYALWRIARCQPFCKGGLDPVP